MNKSQKGALAVLIMTTVLLLFIISIPVALLSNIVILKISPLLFFVLTFLVMGLSIIFLKRKQSPSEVDYDERDIAIKQKAIFASYITLWILVAIICIVPGIMIDRTTIATYWPNILPIELFLLYIIVKLVYALTILVQYGRKEKTND
jgi:hypothetical protein